MSAMRAYVPTESLHHVVLTVSDVERSCEFYTENLGFRKVMDIPGRGYMVSNGFTAIILARAPDPARAITNDRFDENRVGLDHLAIKVGSRAELEAACQLFDERGIPHGEIDDMGSDMKLYGLTLRDPDNTQVELIAPYES